MLNNFLKGQALNPFPFYRSMRESQPIFYQPQQHAWAVFSYADAEQVLMVSRASFHRRLR